MKPKRPTPASRARWTASDVGAPTETSEPTPAATAFWTSSKPARPLTTRYGRGGRLTRQDPRPGHLVDGVVPPDVLAYDVLVAVGGEQPGRVHPTGPAEHVLPLAQQPRQPAYDVRARRRALPTGDRAPS